jgi:hypothetical protein
MESLPLQQAIPTARLNFKQLGDLHVKLNMLNTNKGEDKDTNATVG